MESKYTHSFSYGAKQTTAPTIKAMFDIVVKSYSYSIYVSCKDWETRDKIIGVVAKYVHDTRIEGNRLSLVPNPCYSVESIIGAMCAAVGTSSVENA